jgi:dihydrofolate reductase
LDGYIAGPQGEADWIMMDPEIDFDAFFREFDTLLIGRRTFETMGSRGGTKGIQVLVFSRTLRPAEHPRVRIVSDRVDETLRELRAQPGKDIWLFGGGLLFRSLLELNQVDTVEIGLMPVVLGGGIPLLPSPAVRRRLSLTGHKVYGSGIVSLQYAVVPEEAARPRAARRRSAARGAVRSGTAHG